MKINAFKEVVELKGSNFTLIVNTGGVLRELWVKKSFKGETLPANNKFSTDVRVLHDNEDSGMFLKKVSDELLVEAVQKSFNILAMQHGLKPFYKEEKDIEKIKEIFQMNHFELMTGKYKNDFWFYRNIDSDLEEKTAWWESGPMFKAFREIRERGLEDKLRLSSQSVKSLFAKDIFVKKKYDMWNLFTIIPLKEDDNKDLVHFQLREILEIAKNGYKKSPVNKGNNSMINMMDNHMRYCGELVQKIPQMWSWANKEKSLESTKIVADYIDFAQEWITENRESKLSHFKNARKGFEKALIRWRCDTKSFNYKNIPAILDRQTTLKIDEVPAKVIRIGVQDWIGYQRDVHNVVVSDKVFSTLTEQIKCTNAILHGFNKLDTFMSDTEIKKSSDDKSFVIIFQNNYGFSEEIFDKAISDVLELVFKEPFSNKKTFYKEFAALHEDAIMRNEIFDEQENLPQSKLLKF